MRIDDDFCLDEDTREICNGSAEPRPVKVHKITARQYFARRCKYWLGVLLLSPAPYVLLAGMFYYAVNFGQH